ncbi:agamous-like MADS-box protein AGL80 [Carica papaya]|uniref:agamous-like MADS-box protein AGL80 n=1 Tax=Carica papaya TaxID=3649 RepID=UPI000B8C93F5|nr:agamous-like MADS-box protein AGL80 [Carica papaya]
MVRKSVKIAYIVNDKARKVAYKKRCKGLIKKVNELSILCDVEACAIIYGEYSSQPEVWPSSSKAQDVITRFQMMPESEQKKKILNQESYLIERLHKITEKLDKQVKRNREEELTQIMLKSLSIRCIKDLELKDLDDLGWIINRNMKEIEWRKNKLKSVDNNSKLAQETPKSSAEATPPVQVTALAANPSIHEKN